MEIVGAEYNCLAYDRVHGLIVTYADLWVPCYSGAIDCTAQALRYRAALASAERDPPPKKRNGPDARRVPDPPSVSRPKVVACGRSNGESDGPA